MGMINASSIYSGYISSSSLYGDDIEAGYVYSSGDIQSGGTVSGSVGSFSSLNVYGDVSITGAYRTTANQLAFSFSGDQYGGGNFILRNRNGQNGLLLFNSAGAAQDLYDIQVLGGGGGSLIGSVRFEGRGGVGNFSVNTPQIQVSAPIVVDTVSLVNLIGYAGQSSGQVRATNQLSSSYASNVSGSTRGRVIEYVDGSGAMREVRRIESDGTRGYQIQTVSTTAPADSMLVNGSVSFYSDASGNLKIKLKDPSGTVRTGTITLT